MPIVSHLFDNGTQPPCLPNFPHVTIPKVEYYTILYSTIRYYLQLAGSRDQIALVDENPGGFGGEYPELCTPRGFYLTFGGTFPCKSQ